MYFVAQFLDIVQKISGSLLLIGVVVLAMFWKRKLPYIVVKWTGLILMVTALVLFIIYACYGIFSGNCLTNLVAGAVAFILARMVLKKRVA